jgi:hypothetical protein
MLDGFFKEYLPVSILGFTRYFAVTNVIYSSFTAHVTQPTTFERMSDKF